MRLLRPLLRAAAAVRRWPPLPAGVVISDLAIGGSEGSGKIRLYTPTAGDGRMPVLLWVHGGGLVIGDHRDDQWGTYYAASVGMAVVSAAYRLAPEHPYPAALDDITVAARWVLTGGNGRFDPDRVAIGGESAGGGLAAALVQRLTDEGSLVAGQLLVYPMLDDRTAVRPDIGDRDHVVWSKASNRFGWSSYLGVEPGGHDPPAYASPGRRLDLSGLPPAWVGVGSIDLFYDESVAYADRLRRAGVGCELEIVDGAPHGFASIAPSAELTEAFRRSSADFLARVLRRPVPR